MTLFEKLRQFLPDDSGRPALMVQASLEWHTAFGKTEFAQVVIWTDRQLTSKGGNGWDGLDGKDMLEIDKAVTAYVDAEGAHMIKGFIVRQRRGILPPISNT